MDEAWSVDALSKRRERVAAHGISLDMLPLPMSSKEIWSAEMPAIFLGKSPERDRNIDDICQMIRNCSRAGHHAGEVQLHAARRAATGTAPGRGTARYSEFVYAGAKQDPPLTIAGKVDADTYWERITYFLERVVPVAEEYKVRMGCHPQDPGMPKGPGWRGVDAVLGSPEGLKRFISIKESPYHGLNFCQGTVSEQLEKPGEQIFDVIRYFGIAEEDLQRALPQHRGRLPELPRDVHRQRQRRHAEGDAGLQGGRLRRHDDARSRPADRGRRPDDRASCSRSATSRR